MKFQLDLRRFTVLDDCLKLVTFSSTCPGEATMESSPGPPLATFESTWPGAKEILSRQTSFHDFSNLNWVSGGPIWGVVSTHLRADPGALPHAAGASRKRTWPRANGSTFCRLLNDISYKTIVKIRRFAIFAYAPGQDPRTFRVPGGGLGT